jgi:S-adenosylmethionine:tRNA ribosyltransferase-isomerase
MLTSDFDYDLPPELIAQEPPAARDAARMLVVERASGRLTHATIGDLPAWLDPGDLAVLNDTRVFPARLNGAWSDTGGRVELLLVEAEGDAAPAAREAVWRCLCGSGRRVRAGLQAHIGEIAAQVLGVDPGGRVRVRLTASAPLADAIERLGCTPLPPYIRRAADDPRGRADRERYQTVYAVRNGAVAAPTAGLHFTPALFDALAARGVERAFVTLHVGPGTFAPVTAERIEDHHPDEERYDVPAATATALGACRSRGGRVLAVGTTTVRTIETFAARGAATGRTDLFIRPPYRFAWTDRLLTNFHLPRSTLLMLVAAFAGTDLVRAAYREAVARRYRFYSYGDCMLCV